MAAPMSGDFDWDEFRQRTADYPLSRLALLTDLAGVDYWRVRDWLEAEVMRRRDERAAESGESDRG
jgi:hypothetical protein